MKCVWGGTTRVGDTNGDHIQDLLKACMLVYYLGTQTSVVGADVLATTYASRCSVLDLQVLGQNG